MEALQKLNENRKVGVGVGMAIIILAFGLIGFQLYGSGTNAAVAPTNAFYTDDDGKTFFRDDVNRIPPFDHNGKKAYRADVFKGSDGKQFVGLVYRFTDAGRKEMDAFISKHVKDPDGLTRQSIEQRGMQVKMAGAPDKNWVLADEMTAERLQRMVKDASGKPALIVTP